MLRALMDRGNVRVTVLNHTKYHLKSCDYFYPPSSALSNYHYWGEDEFVDGVDSDLVFLMQGDAVLCHELNVDKWRDVAWVGAPWPPRLCTSQYCACNQLPTIWKNSFEDGGDQAEPPPVPAFPTPEEMCSDIRYGPQGNGGVSLRSRSWLRKAIRYCPVTNRKWTGLSLQDHQAAQCKIWGALEDVHFSTILRGIGAPLPNGYEAALFAMEMSTPLHIADRYNLTRSFQEEMVRKRWWSPEDPTGMDHFRNMMGSSSTTEYPVVSIAIHKPWNDRLKKRIHEDHLNEQCPYMKRMMEGSKYGRKHLRLPQNSSSIKNQRKRAKRKTLP